MRRRRDVAGLIGALGYTDVVSIDGGRPFDAAVPIRRRALDALAPLVDVADVPGIAVALEDCDPTIRQATVRVIRDLDAVALAHQDLARVVVAPPQPEFDAVRRESLAALHDLAIQGEQCPARDVAIAAVEGGQIVALDEVTREGLTSLVDLASEAEVDHLVDELIEHLAMQEQSPDNAQVVLAWLAPHSTHALIVALRRGGYVRGLAAAVLGAIRDSQALQPLVDALEDDHPDVRRVVVWALGELQDPRAVDALMRATMDEEYRVRRQAGDALDAMGSVAFMAGVATMIRSLEDQSYKETVTRLAEEGFQQIPSNSRVASDQDTEAKWTPSFLDRLQLRWRSP